MFGVLRPHTPNHADIPIPQSADPPPLHSLAPMPSTEFSSREELLDGCKDWAASQGFAVVIARSRLNRLWLKCDRGGKYENRRNLTTDQRKRKRGESRLLGCPFRMIASCKKDIWRADTENGDHNHGPSDDLSAHPTLRRMTDEQLQKVHEMYDAGRSPAETMEELRAIWPDIKVLTRDIYNARKKYKTERDEAEAANGTSQQRPYQDPNELGLAGPDPRGRWAWVPEGEEVTNKKSKRKRRSAPPAQAAPNPALDPQLQTPHIFTSTPQTIRNASDPSADAYSQLHDAAHHEGSFERRPDSVQLSTPADVASNRANSISTTFNVPATPLSEAPTTNEGQQSDTTAMRLRSQGAAAPIATMSAESDPSQTNGPDSDIQPPEPKAQVLMSRIERMEKEQRDQKNMLAQILGAVQGFQGSPGPEART